MVDVPLVIAFVAGLVSFLSPCVLPIVPGFLAYLAGTSMGAENRLRIFLNSFIFVLGFSFIFALLGVLLNTVLQASAYDVQIWLARIGGVIIIFFGLYLSGLLHVSFLDREHKFLIKGKLGNSYIMSFLFGAAFAAGWTPCVGAALGAILGLAASAPAKAFYLLFSYSLGLGLPFLFVGLFVSRAQNFFNRYASAFLYISKAFGIILIVLGIFVFTQSLNLIANFGFLNSLLLK